MPCNHDREELEALSWSPRSSVSEFFSALGDPFTVSPRNSYLLFGFLWGLPVPFFSVCMDLFANGRPFEAGTIAETFLSHPIHWIFALHPLLFAVVFGALGTVRQKKDRHIANLIAVLRKAVDRRAATPPVESKECAS